MLIEQLIELNLIEYHETYYIVDLDDKYWYDKILDNLKPIETYHHDHKTTEGELLFETELKILNKRISIRAKVKDVYLEEFDNGHKRILINKEDLLNVIIEKMTNLPTFEDITSTS